MNDTGQEFFTAKQLAERWQMSIDTVYALPIRRVKLGKHLVRFPRKAVEAYESRGFEQTSKEKSA